MPWSALSFGIPLLLLVHPQPRDAELRSPLEQAAIKAASEKGGFGLSPAPTHYMSAFSVRSQPRKFDSPFPPTPKSIKTSAKVGRAFNFAPNLSTVSFSGASLGKWQNLLTRHDGELSRDTFAWGALVDPSEVAGSPDLLAMVNERVNRVPYVSDDKNWRMPDYWETPSEFLRRGGDCEDYAITKYLLLRQLGYSAIDMDVAVSKDHAILIVNTPNGPMVLDNLRDKPYRLKKTFANQVVFTINEVRWIIAV